jgi:proteasome lid subunit RPN8/RPN11
VVLSRRAHDDIVAHAREAAPAECCGVLIGAGQRIADAVRTANVDANPNRFEIDPGDHLRAIRAARTRGLEVLGFYHSHPHSAPTPSPSDRAEASYPDHLYLIVSPRGEPVEVRLYRLEADGFKDVPWTLEEVPLEVPDPGTDVDDHRR